MSSLADALHLPCLTSVPVFDHRRSSSSSSSGWLQSARGVHACRRVSAASLLWSAALCIFGNGTSELRYHPAPERDPKGSDSIKNLNGILYQGRKTLLSQLAIFDRPCLRQWRLYIGTYCEHQSMSFFSTQKPESGKRWQFSICRPCLDQPFFKPTPCSQILKGKFTNFCHLKRRLQRGVCFSSWFF